MAVALAVAVAACTEEPQAGDFKFATQEALEAAKDIVVVLADADAAVEGSDVAVVDAVDADVASPTPDVVADAGQEVLDIAAEVEVVDEVTAADVDAEVQPETDDGGSDGGSDVDSDTFEVGPDPDGGDGDSTGQDAATTDTVCVCSDENPCTDEVCDPQGKCSHPFNTSICDDKSGCTLGDLCDQGVCKGTTAKNCDDGLVCTDDGCDLAAGCTHTTNSKDCDDANDCTLADKCADKLCKPGTKLNCDDANVCTDDSCDAKGGCKHGSNTAVCGSGPCTIGNVCKAGICSGGKPTDCDDKKVCTDDSCDPVKGCLNSNNSVGCDDGDACTDNDQCVAGSCTKGAAVACDDKNPCTTDGCEKTGGCKYANNSVGCDDTNVCTEGDKCSGGACGGGAPKFCDDKNPCTDDSCDEVKGCLALPNAAACSDGDTCSSGDACVAGACKGTSVYAAGLAFPSAGTGDELAAATLVSNGEVVGVGTINPGTSRSGRIVSTTASGLAGSFDQTLKGSGAGTLAAVIADGPGIAAAGVTGKDVTAIQNGPGDGWFVRVSGANLVQTSQNFDAGGDETFYGIVKQGNNFRLVGHTSNSGGYKGWLPLVDGNGKIVQGGGTFYGISGATSVGMAGAVVLADGTLLVVGNSNATGFGKRDGCVWRLAADGTELFHQQFGGAGDDELKFAALQADGAVIAYGNKAGVGWMVKLLPSGAVLWDRTLANTGDLRAVAPAFAGGLTVAARTNSQSGLLIGTDSVGNKLWERPFDKYLGGLVASSKGFTLAGAVVGASDAQDAAFRFTDIWGYASCKDAGKCSGVSTCDDKVQCTDDVCASAAGCTHVAANDGQSCDDGATCTSLDACAGGKCAAGGDMLYAKLLPGGKADDYVRGVVAAPDGGTVVGSIVSYDKPDSVNSVKAYRPDGSLRFDTPMGGAVTAGGSNMLTDVNAFPKGGYIATGRLIPLNPKFSEWHSMVARLSESGAILWQNLYPTAQGSAISDDVDASAVRSDGVTVVVGNQNFGSALRLLEIDKNGKKISENTYSPAQMGNGTFRGVAPSPAGGYWAVGYSFVNGDYDGWLGRFAANGSITKTYSVGQVGSYQVFYRLLVDAEGLTVVGQSQVLPSPNTDAWLVRFDLNGEVLWQKHFGGPGQDAFSALVGSGDGGYYVAGGVVAGNDTARTAALFRLSAQGTELWRVLSGGPEGLWNAVARAPNGTVLLGGYTNVKALGGNDPMVAVVDDFGNASCAASGSCLATLPSACTDTDPCTTDTCTSGKCAHPAGVDGVACDDGAPCTTGDACAGGTCSAGKASLWLTQKGTNVAEEFRGVAVGPTGTIVASGYAGTVSKLVGQGIDQSTLFDIKPTKAQGEHNLKTVVPTSNGGFVAVGAHKNGLGEPVDESVYVIQVDATGKIAWEFGRTNKEGQLQNNHGGSGTGIALRPNGGVVVVGYYGAYFAPGIFWYQGVLTEIGPTGTVDGINKLYDVPSPYARQFYQRVAVAPAGGYWVGALVQSAGSLGGVAKLVSIHANGNVMFDKDLAIIANGKSQTITQLIADKDGVTVFGASGYSKNGSEDAWMARVDNNNVVQFNKHFEVAGPDAIEGAAVLPAGGFIVAGRGTPPGKTKEHPWLAKMTVTGDVVWQKYFDSPDSAWLGVAVTVAGNIALGGRTAFNSNGPTDTLLARCDAFGNCGCASSGNCLAKTPADCDDKNPCTLDTCTAGTCVSTALQDGADCGQGSICSAGKCFSCASEGKSVCGGTCANLKVDAANCGSCGKACPGGTCSGGKCTSCVFNLPTDQPWTIAYDIISCDNMPVGANAVVTYHAEQQITSACGCGASMTYDLIATSGTASTTQPSGLGAGLCSNQVFPEDGSTPPVTIASSGKVVGSVKPKTCLASNCGATPVCYYNHMASTTPTVSVKVISGLCTQNGTGGVCDDGNTCTTDLCSAQGNSCTNTANTATCDDGNLCTTNDKCAASTCKGAASVVCDDGNPATVDNCDAATGKCKFTVNNGGIWEKSTWDNGTWQ